MVTEPPLIKAVVKNLQARQLALAKYVWGRAYGRAASQVHIMLVVRPINVSNPKFLYIIVSDILVCHIQHLNKP